MEASNSSLLFLTKANKVEILNYENEKTIKSFTFNDEPSMMYTKSFFSPTKNYYVAYGQREIKFIDVKTLTVLFNKNLEGGSLLHFRFLD